MDDFDRLVFMLAGCVFGMLVGAVAAGRLVRELGRVKAGW